MREILFRGKSTGDGEWVQGWLSQKTIIPESDQAFIALAINAPYDKPFDVEWYIIDPATVGQYTGLTDKNGKKIFEGDIVRHHNDNPYALPSIFEKGKVYWDEQYCGWRRTSNGAFHHGCVDTYRMALDCVYEVVGNIHDNPELLED